MSDRLASFGGDVPRRLRDMGDGTFAELVTLAGPTSSSRIASAANTTNPTSAKATPGSVFKAFGNNAKAAIVYLKLYDKASAPTVGTDTPVLVIPIAASGRFELDIGGAPGFRFATGIAYGFTTDAADNGTTALAAADILDFALTFN